MMQIVYFSQKDQLLAEIKGQSSDRVFIAPSPLKADNLRVLLGSDSANDVVTIAKFTGDLLTSLWVEESERPVVKRKSELLLIFGILKNKYFPDLGYEQFTQSYNLFSDLRSFSLNQEALGPALEEQPEDIKKAVQMFWKLLVVMGVQDEHAAYNLISEQLRTHQEVEELKKTFIFWGFQHVNGQQVDLIKSLAIRYNVIIPFPLALKDQLKNSDWISWLRDHKVEEKFLPKIEKSPRGDWLVVNSREMSRHLKHHCGPGTQVVLGLSKLTPHHIDIIPFSDVNFKVTHNLLQSELTEVVHALKVDQPENLLAWLTEQKKQVLSMGKTISYKKLKILQLYEEAMGSISELTDEVPTSDIFFQKLLRDVVSLNQPRTSFVPTLETVASIELKDMSTLEDIDRSRPVILCVDERFDDFQGLGQSYPESIQKALASLGPIKRNELDLQFKQWEMIDLFSKAKVLVLMPESVQKHSLVWKKVFESITLDKVISDFSLVPRKPLDYFKTLLKKPFEGSYSASKLQTFYDCPRKFYYNYVEKISPTVTLERDIDNKISGTLVHRIIELYFERSLTEEKISDLAREVLDLEIQKSQLKIPADIYSERLLIFTHRAANGIRLLKKLEETTGQKINWEIELKFEDEGKYHIKGSIDCVGESQTHLYLLDFKSTDSSASTNKDVLGIESLQLWVYILAAEKLIPDFSGKSLAFGYVVLDEPEKSNICFVDNDLLKQIKDSSPKICSPFELKDDFPEVLERARLKLETIALNVFSEKVFPSRPRNADACTYCELSAVCTKGEA